ncbi:hypothetical protein GCM10010495_79120 [Kitasatospora herbaricolor]|uniref:DEAD/DEAH box helicase n=1 Tax=Kitasatospora herbaricolor TaxID=68217 RepID=UPI00174E5B5C|nr:DEAD/DEAH box helicase [Kitasatospora herbaricolor]MDQ0305580.1 ATP-dependent DNA helicase RecQ [Kitasatospora herbaricolor]GGV49517.1 hypothetical protein GCM10010495_79120 [Kitasatospora herbaricolor]
MEQRHDNGGSEHVGGGSVQQGQHPPVQASLPSSVTRLVDLVAQATDGITVPDLTAAVRAKYPGFPSARVSDLKRAIAGGALIEETGRVRVPRPVPTPAAQPRTVEPALGSSGFRVVAFDLESISRSIAVAPWTDRRIFQIGAVRMGTDETWSTEQPRFERWVALPEGEWELSDPVRRKRHAAEAVGLREAIEGLRAFCGNADLIIAHNGNAADFPLLDEECRRAGIPVLDTHRADSLYLAHALLPVSGSHRLASIAEEFGADQAGLTAHDAVDDAVLLSRILRQASSAYALWPAEQRDLVFAVCPDSRSWLLLRHLAGLSVTAPMSWTTTAVSAAVDRTLTGHAPRRDAGAASGRAALTVGVSLRGADGRVDPTSLASTIRAKAQRREAQEEMAAALHAWTDAAVPALVEAPTGTGKSLAVLACALDWLAGAPDRVAVIATNTKQLQNQLARDVDALEKSSPGLLAASDLVKGSTNRLSLRSLISALTQATDVGRDTHGGRRFLEQPEYRELLVYLWLRLSAAIRPPLSWTARSVDPVDVPPHFVESIGPRLGEWLLSLSQGVGGEYLPSSGSFLARHTDTVREALSSHRLLLANHALVLSHLDDLRAMPGEVLLVMDEAHQVEDAATSALTVSFDYAVVEDMVAECTAWARTARSGPSGRNVQAVLDEMESMLDHEQLPRAVAEAFDGSAVGGALVGSRTTTLAGPFSGSSGVRAARAVQRHLRTIAALTGRLTAALAAHAAQNVPPLDFFESERLAAMYARAGDLKAAADTVTSDIDAVLGPSTSTAQPRSRASDGVVPPSASSAAHSAQDEAAEDHEDVPQTAEQEALPGLPPMPNRLVYAEESEIPRAGLRNYRFRLSSSPIELPADPDWQRFLSAFPRTYYVSATLRVAGSWDFVRGRLGLPASMAALHLRSPFPLGRQTEVVCLADFPSWAEQQDGAMRTVAHQLAGYAAEMVRPAASEEGDGLLGRGGWDGGALVLTTARATAAGISDRLATELRRRGHQAPVLNAVTLGNSRGFRDFTDRDDGGGFLVGTRGLWQGVDVEDERRLSLVWINKLPFAPFAAPLVEARRAAVRARAEAACEEDPDAFATYHYYLPLAAIQLRQAVGRLIRSDRHRGIVIISDRKLAGRSALRRAYRRTFLGSLEPELLRPDPLTGEPGGGNVVGMAEGWARIWGFLADHGLLAHERAAELSQPETLLEHVLLPQTRRIRELELTSDQVTELRRRGSLAEEVLRRSAEVAGLLRLTDEPASFRLKAAQQAVIGAVAEGRNVLALLPTGFGKSYTFQLPALVMPGTTIVVSPLVALMQDQALELNRSIGGAVRALVAPLRESSSRAGKTEVAEQLLGRGEHGIKLVYVSPERLCQRRFREVVRRGAELGRVGRIVLDEAHTIVQWDDFRPGMQRVERFLAELRADFGLSVTALTATANRTVHAGLREGVFELPGEPPAVGSPAERREERSPGVRGSLVTVRENPIRPELAVFRRALGRSGPVTAARLAEEVVDTVRDHAVVYCLTVKEVVILHAHLRDYLGESGRRVRRFHGRLTEAEKAAVMAEFREAPRRGEEGFAPLIVVATTAFGLGIDRDDIRTVFCASAPTDLAALYQQVGRAGRDVAGRGAPGEADEPPNVGLALLTGRGLRTIAWMTGIDLAPSLFVRMGEQVLAARDGFLDATQIADTLIGEDLAAGRLTDEDARRARTAEAYRTGVMRTFTALASLGAVTDLGDFPPRCAVREGESERSSAADPVEQAVAAIILALPARSPSPGRLHRSALDVVRLDDVLVRSVDGYRAYAEGPAGTWELLADLHDRGVLDVSAAPSDHLVSSLRIHHNTVPAALSRQLAGRAERSARETALLRDFFTDTTTCSQRKFADYFGVPDLPPGCCTNAANRCSACWEDPGLPREEIRPDAAKALATPIGLLRGASPRVDAEHLQRRLDEQIYQLIWAVHRGLHPSAIRRALHGEESWYSPRLGRRARLHPALRNNRHFGARADVAHADVEASLARLAAADRVRADETRWRAVPHLRASRTS